MHIVTFSHDGRIQHGVRAGDRIRLHPSAGSAVELAMDPTSHLARGEVALADVDLLSPVPAPGKVICIGLNYRAHAEEGGFAVPDYPTLFLRVTTSLVGPGRPIILPDCSEQLDYEAELGVVIGRTAMNVRENPLDYVAGYCCFNDGSIRDYQRRTSQWTSGKNFDQTGAFGADLVTPDELPAGASGLRITSRLNGQTMQDSNTADLIFDVPTLIATISETMTLEPGDVIATGTPSGVGHARKPPVWMRKGDEIEIDIEGIGKATNIVARRQTDR